jgi:PEP-CTERM motif
MLRNALLIGAAAAALGAIAAPALADNITTNVWYDVGFNSTGSPLVGPGFAIGFDQPFGGVAFAPSGTSWTITLSHPATLTIVDTETSGDQFTMFNNGGLLGTTSAPCDFCSSGIGNDIGLALADLDYSRGSFTLPAGVNTISGTFDGVVGFGDADFVVTTSVPEPATWALMLIGFGGLGGAIRSRRRAVAAV